MQLQDIVEWMRSFALQYGYLGIFLISLLGALSIFIPIPYTVVIFTLGGLRIGGDWAFDPLWIAVAAGTGAAVGEFSGYLIGFGGRRVIGEKYKKKMDFLTKLFKKFGPVVIFVFALTPLPDDLLFIPLGIMRYSLLQAFIPALLGKFVSNLIIAYSGRLSLQIIRDLFGVEGEGMSALIGIVLALVLLVVVFVIMFKVDWENRFAKYVNEPEDNICKSSEGKLTGEETRQWIRKLMETLAKWTGKLKAERV
ncbi:MAG: VTT domain-containing protein [Candidatus Bathyarchaeota archaeon]|nr:VTT domain-containing protein [Candidatus Bathyarchaeota archaeon]